MSNAVVKLPSQGVHAGAVAAAASALYKGQVIATPTDTIYGIAALVQERKGVQKLYDIKGRDLKKPIAISVAEVDDIYHWGQVTVEKALLEELLPGPVTVIFKRKERLNPEFNPQTDLVGIRVPNYPFLRSLCRHCEGPIALTSANVSAEKSSLEVKEFESLWPHLALVFDGGRIGDTEEARLGSTIVDLSSHGTYKVVRNGSALDHTEKVLRSFGLFRIE